MAWPGWEGGKRKKVLVVGVVVVVVVAEKGGVLLGGLCMGEGRANMLLCRAGYVGGHLPAEGETEGGLSLIHI